MKLRRKDYWQREFWRMLTAVFRLDSGLTKGVNLTAPSAREKSAVISLLGRQGRRKLFPSVGAAGYACR